MEDTQTDILAQVSDWWETDYSQEDMGIDQENNFFSLNEISQGSEMELSTGENALTDDSQNYSENALTDDSQNYEEQSLSENASTDDSQNYEEQFLSENASTDDSQIDADVLAQASDWQNYLAESWDISQFDGSGSPEIDAEYWEYQGNNNSCAVVAQMTVCESITGLDLNQSEVARIAQENGWYDPERGTDSENVGKILEYYGIPTEKKYNASLDDIAAALERGDKVIVGLDSNEIWYPQRDANGNPVELPNAGHAVWVTGIDPQPDGSVKIILNDSGTPNGQMEVVDAKDFINAWEDCGNLIVVADTPDPSMAV